MAGGGPPNVSPAFAEEMRAALPAYQVHNLATDLIEEISLSIADYQRAKARVTPAQRARHPGRDLLAVAGTLFARHWHQDAGAQRSRRGAGYPRKSWAMGCPPQQIPDQIDYYKRRGVNVTFTRRGQLIAESAAHDRAIRKAGNFYDIDGYSD